MDESLQNFDSKKLLYHNSCNYNHYNNYFSYIIFSKLLIQISSYKFQIVNNYVQLENSYEITVIN